MLGIADRHLVWKEHRLLTPLWGVLATLLLVSIGWLTIATVDSSLALIDQVAGVNAILVVFGSMLALASGIALFSSEKEQGTDALLARLPISGRRVVAVKFLTGFAYILLFQLFSLGLLGLASLWWEVAALPVLFGSDGLGWMNLWIVPLEVYGWSSLLSLLISRPLAAALTTPVAFLVTRLILDSMVAVLWPPSSDSYWTWVQLVHALVVVLLILGISVAGRSWLRQGESFSSGGWRGRLKMLSGDRSGSSLPARFKAAILWQTWRQRRVAVIGLAGGSFLFGLAWWLACPLRGTSFPPSALYRWNAGGWVYALVAGIWVGLQTFGGDHDITRRFFQQHGGFPRALAWIRWSWIAFGALIVLLTVGVVYGAVTLNSPKAGLLIGMGQILAVYLIVASVGQLVSLLFRSTVWTILVGLTAGGLSAAYVSYLLLAEPGGLRLTLLYGMPLAVAALLTSWYFLPAWVADRGGWLQRALPVAILMAVAVALLFLVRHDRLSIPATDLDRQWEHEVLEYRQARADFLSDAVDADTPRKRIWKALSVSRPLSDFVDEQGIDRDGDSVGFPQDWPDSVLEAYVKANQPATRLLEEAFRLEPESPFLDPASTADRRGQVASIRLLLEASIESALRASDLDRAEDWLRAYLRASRLTGLSSLRAVSHLIRWAESPGQTSQRLHEALQKLETGFEDPRRVGNIRLRLDYYEFLESFERGRGPGNVSFDSLPARGSLILLVPWERERRRRGIGLAVEAMIDQVDRLERQFVFRGYEIPLSYGNSNFVESALWRQPEFAEFVSEPPLTATYREFNAIQYARVRLALAAARLDRGTYPRDLGELVPEYLEALPVDPVTGASFAWHPDGFENEVWVGWRGHVARQQSRITVNRRSLQSRSLQGGQFLPSNIPILLPWPRGEESVQTIAISDEAEGESIGQTEVREMMHIPIPHPIALYTPLLVNFQFSLPAPGESNQALDNN